MEKENNNTLAFLDVFFNNRDSTNLITSVYRKKTFTGLLASFFSFTSSSCKFGLIRTLIDRAYKISSTLLGFNKEVKTLSYIFKKSQYPEGLINTVLNKYLDNISKSTALSVDSKPPDGLCTLYFKLPYLALSTFTKRKLHTLVKRYFENLEIKLVFSSFKTKSLMNVKDSIPRSLRSNVICKFICAGCNSVYVGETIRHFATRVHEHLHSDKNSHIYKHLKSSDKCRMSCGDIYFTVLDTASTYNHLKIKEALHIVCEKPLLNKQVNHYDISLSF